MSRVFVHLSVSYPNLNICLRGLKMMNAHNFLIVFPCNIGERQLLHNLYSKTYKPAKGSLSSSSQLLLHVYSTVFYSPTTWLDFYFQGN